MISVGVYSDSMQALAEVPQARHVPGFGVLIDDCRTSLCACQQIRMQYCCVQVQAHLLSGILYLGSQNFRVDLLQRFEASCLNIRFKRSLAQGYRAAKCGTGSAEVSDYSDNFFLWNLNSLHIFCSLSSSSLLSLSPSWLQVRHVSSATGISIRGSG